MPFSLGKLQCRKQHFPALSPKQKQSQHGEAPAAPARAALHGANVPQILIAAEEALICTAPETAAPAKLWVGEYSGCH